MHIPPEYPATRDYLYALKNRGSKYGIDRMRCFVEALKHPEQSFPSIHVAGTNGKGSVCAMLEAIYRANGYSTGLYTSPHLIRQGERIQVNRSLLDEADIVNYTTRLRVIAEQLAERDSDDHPSFFEFMTAMAFLRFAEMNVDIAILETGLGGRLDATNVVTPQLSIITSISLDHTELLGDTIELIAAEKAGIIKPRLPVVIGKLPPEAEAVIRAIAHQRGSRLYSVRERFASEAMLPKTNLAGSFQLWNAGIALLASEVMQENFTVEETESRKALQAISWRGRWEKVALADRTLILDATHNPEGVEALKENLAKLVKNNGKKPIIVASALGTDRAKALIPILADFAGELHLITPQQDRAISTKEMASFLSAETSIQPIHSRIQRIIPRQGTCELGQPGDTIVITGSLYLIGEVLERLTLAEPINQGSLQDKP